MNLSPGDYVYTNYQNDLTTHVVKRVLLAILYQNQAGSNEYYNQDNVEYWKFHVKYNAEVLVSFPSSDTQYVTITRGTRIPDHFCKYNTVESVAATAKSNLDTLSELFNYFSVYTEQLGYYHVNGGYVGQDSYHSKSSYVLPCTPGEIYLYTGNASTSSTTAAVFYDEVGHVVSVISNIGEPTDYEITVPNRAYYVMFSSYNRISNDVVYNVHKKYIRSTILNQMLTYTSADMLSHKNWYVYGDSFTQGVVDGYPDLVITSGRYEGCYNVYPYIIGNRTDMNVTNLAAGGGVLATPDDTRYTFSQHYTEVPDDAEYITLAFGINDCSHCILGTINDSTVATFYGAWNVILPYLIEHHPYAKIGIIVINGMGADATGLAFTNAQIECAEKWGIPYLNIATGKQVPLMNRTGKTYVDPAAIQLRNVNFAIDYAHGNTHPSPKAHEYMSTFIETWLRSL